MFVDFEHISFEHATMIHVPFEGAHFLLDTLYREKALDIMEVRIKPPFTCCTMEQNGVAKVPTQLCMIFTSKTFVRVERVAALKRLWSVLHAHNLTVVWKHGLQGYEVGADYAILDSWELDDDMSQYESE